MEATQWTLPVNPTTRREREALSLVHDIQKVRQGRCSMCKTASTVFACRTCKNRHNKPVKLCAVPCWGLFHKQVDAWRNFEPQMPEPV